MRFSADCCSDPWAKYHWWLTVSLWFKLAGLEVLLCKEAMTIPKWLLLTFQQQQKQITFLKNYVLSHSNDVDILRWSSLQVVPCVWQIALPISEEMPARIPHWELGHTRWWSRQCKCYTSPSNGTQLSGSWVDEQKRIKQDGFRVFQVGGCGLTCVFVPTLVIPAWVNALAVKADILGADHKKVDTTSLLHSPRRYKI